MDPRKEDDGPGCRHMESDILVELYDAVQRRLSSQRDERSANWEQDHGYIKM